MSVQAADFDQFPKAIGNSVQRKKAKKESQHLKKLRILSGVNKGASVDIDDGIYELGSSENCDLIIDDTQVKNHHLFLEVNNGEISVCPIGTQVYIRGKRCSNKQIIKFFDVILVGKTSFCIGPRYKTWPRIKAIRTPVTEEVDNSFDNQTDDDSTAAEQARFKLYHQKKITKTTKLVIPILLSLCLILGIFSFGILLPVQVNSTTPQKKSINELIIQEGLNESVSLQYNQKNELELSGYITNKKKFHNLKAAMLNKYPAVRLRIWTASELLLRANEVLQSLGIEHINVSLVEKGNLTFKGYIPKKSDWKDILRVLSQDIPDVITIDDKQIYSLQQILDNINKHIITSQLDQWVSVESQNKTIKLTGILPKNRFPAWPGFLENFRQQMGFHVDIDDQVTDAKNQIINLPVKSISIGKVSYLTLKDNSKYIEGSLISDGFILQSIHLDHIVISKNNIEYDYYIGIKDD